MKFQSKLIHSLWIFGPETAKPKDWYGGRDSPQSPIVKIYSELSKYQLK